jgi:hypothetical protein
MKFNIFFILAFQFCLQCSYVYVNPDYHSVGTTKKNLLIYPVPISNIAIQDSTLLKLISKDFKISREDAVQVVDSLLQQSIVNAFEQYGDSSRVQITTCNKSIDSGSGRHIPSGFHFDTLVKRLTGDEIPSAEYFAEQDCPVDYILFVSEIELDISYDLDIDGGINSRVIEVSLANRYVFDADDITFKIWDYTKNRFISKATIHTDTVALRCEQPFVEVPQNGQCDNRFQYWPTVFAPIGTAMINATPFKKDKDEGWGQ